MILGIAGTVLQMEERVLLVRHRPKGVILFSRNIENPTQLAVLVEQLRHALPDDSVLMVDQEGGRVARLKPPHWPELPPAATLKTPEAATAHGRALGDMVAQAGFDVAAAPVLDLRNADADAVIGDRALSGDPAVVAALGGAIAAGIVAAGVIPVMKHIPGHGRATVDSHAALPVVAATDLAADFAPFIANNTLPWAMTAHIVYQAYDSERPATLSKTVIRRVIRGMIGFTGTLISDDLAMAALSGTPAARALAALEAGCDLALYCPGDSAGNTEILEAIANAG